MNFRDLATQLVMSKIAGTNNSEAAASALDNLSEGSKGFDLGEIVGRFQQSGGDLAARARSWLGDDSNESISATQIEDVIGADKVAAFARQLGIDGSEASNRLAQILPELIDKSSRGGELLSSLGRSKGLLAGIASRFFRKSA